MQFNPKIGFILGILTTIEIAISSGTVSLTNVVPAMYVPYVVGWCGLLAFIGSTVMTFLHGFSSGQVGPLVPDAPLDKTIMAVDQAVKDVGSLKSQAVAAGKEIPPAPLVILAIAFAALALGYGSPAYAQTPRSRPALTGNPINDIKTDLGQAKAAVTGQPAPNPTAALPCMDVTMLPKLTPQNLIPTMKACIQDVNNQLVTDTQRALDSAKAFTGSATGANAGAVIGDNDAINCLTPALALFQAAAVVPATPDTPAVLNADGTVKTPAVSGTPELDPGPMLLGQKFREFTLAGGLTSCQAWVNEPVQAVTAAAAGNIGAIAGAALLVPK